MSRVKAFLARLGLRPVRYDEQFFGPPWFQEWDRLKLVLGEMLASRPRWRRVLDFGCGPGVMIDLMTARGYRYVGCDNSSEAREIYLRRYGAHPECYRDDLERVVSDEEFDLFLSFDVFEHMTDEQCGYVLKAVAPVPEMLVNISRARGIAGHVNLKSDGGWLELFDRHGWRFRREETDELRELYRRLRPGAPDAWDQNLFLFQRGRARGTG